MLPIHCTRRDEKKQESGCKNEEARKAAQQKPASVVLLIRYSFGHGDTEAIIITAQ